jgi:branched-chain amino acid transport system ATP-binding protein
VSAPPNGAEPLLDVRDLYAGYGKLAVLRGVSLTVTAGELVAVLGPNGAGKSTLLRAISRFDASITAGSVRFAGRDLATVPAQSLVRAGLAHVPEGRQLFTEMTVDDNIRLGAYVTRDDSLEARVDDMYARFPALAERKSAVAFSLSGGEQQMLALARALIARPRLLMLDEPSTGLAPQIVETIFTIVGELRAAGTAILLVEQNAYLTLAHADRAYVLESGVIALSGTAKALAGDPRVQAIYLGGSTDD